ncbi:SGNH/GDSL hydrolase family protein [Enterobacter cloacae]|uniref:tail fiber/spike domain-containing protein n=1 Tax=Enterobacter cloacae TaxID=550 RepID=UPI0034D6ECC3
MTTQPTNLPVPSESPRDLKFNAGKIDEFVTSMALQYIDRFGHSHYTIEGLKQLALQQIYNLGWNPIGSFQDGATLNAAGYIIQDESTGVWYRWDNLSTLPKTVPSGSTPGSTGGVGEGKWLAVDVSDVLRKDLAKPTGAALIGASDGRTVQNWLSDLPDVNLFRGKGLSKLAEMCRAGAAVRIAVYGDSTVDGDRTTGWTKNAVDSSGNAVPNHDHNPEAPNTWPVLLQQLLRDMSENTNISVFNCGYGGKSIVDGWAESNYSTVIENHDTNKAAQFVLIGFGLNDVVNSQFTGYNYSQKLESLIRRVINGGRIPVLVTPDTTCQISENRNMLKLFGQVVPAMKDCAQKYNLDIIDISKYTKSWVENSRNQSDVIADNQEDGLHFGDRGHSFKTGVAAKEIFKDYIIDANVGDTLGFWQGRIAWQGRTVGLNRAIKNRMGCAITVGAGAIAEISRLWIWLEEESDIHYCSPDRDSVSAGSVYSQIGVYDASGVQTIGYVNVGTYAYATSDRPADLNIYLGKKRAGLYRISYRANEVANNVGYIRIGSGTPQGKSSKGLSSSSVWSMPVYNTMPVISVDGSDKSVCIDGTLYQGYAFLFSTNRIFANDWSQSGYISLGVIRNADNTVSLCVFKNVSGAISRTVLATSTATITVDRVMIELRMSPTGSVMYVDINGSRLITYSKAASVAMLPTYGVAGGIVYLTGVSSTSDKTAYHNPPSVF